MRKTLKERNKKGKQGALKESVKKELKKKRVIESVEKKLKERKIKESVKKSIKKRKIRESIEKNLKKKRVLESVEKKIKKRSSNRKNISKKYQESKKQKLQKKLREKRLKNKRRVRESINDEFQMNDYGLFKYNYIDIKQIADEVDFDPNDQSIKIDSQLVQNVDMSRKKDVIEKFTITMKVFDELVKMSNGNYSTYSKTFEKLINKSISETTFGESLQIFLDYLYGEDDVLGQTDQLVDIFGMETTVNVIFGTISDTIEDTLNPDSDEVETSTEDMYGYIQDYFSDSPETMYEIIRGIGIEKIQFVTDEIQDVINDLCEVQRFELLHFVENKGNPDLLVYFL